MIIDHIGILVNSLETSMIQWETMFGYKKNSDIVTNTRQGVRVVFLAKEGSLTVKLFEPLLNSPAAGTLARRGPGLHHICFRCEDLSTGVTELTAKGARQLVAPQPGEAFNNREIAFLFAGNVNVELIDTNEKAGWEPLPTATSPYPVSKSYLKENSCVE